MDTSDSETNQNVLKIDLSEENQKERLQSDNFELILFDLGEHKIDDLDKTQLDTITNKFKLKNGSTLESSLMNENQFVFVIDDKQLKHAKEISKCYRYVDDSFKLPKVTYKKSNPIITQKKDLTCIFPPLGDKAFKDKQKDLSTMITKAENKTEKKNKEKKNSEKKRKREEETSEKKHKKKAKK
eukprot:gene3751-6639_t